MTRASTTQFLSIRLLPQPTTHLQALVLILLHGGDALVPGVDVGGDTALGHGVLAGGRVELDGGAAAGSGTRSAKHCPPQKTPVIINFTIQGNALSVTMIQHAQSASNIHSACSFLLVKTSRGFLS